MQTPISLRILLDNEKSKNVGRLVAPKLEDGPGKVDLDQNGSIGNQVSEFIHQPIKTSTNRKFRHNSSALGAAARSCDFAIELDSFVTSLLLAGKEEPRLDVVKLRVTCPFLSWEDNMMFVYSGEYLLCMIVQSPFTKYLTFPSPVPVCPISPLKPSSRTTGYRLNPSLS